MISLIIRILFVIISLIIGCLVGSSYGIMIPAILITMILISMFILAEIFIQKLSTKGIISGVIGLIIGLALANLLSLCLLGIPQLKEISGWQLSLNLGLGYIGLMMGIIRKHEMLDIFAHSSMVSGKVSAVNNDDKKILDTSVIIDGRIEDICETGFLTGTLIAPRFVLLELQRIADSSDSLKRTRGRRGMDILHKIQKRPNINVEISEIDYPDVREVDSKLLCLAKELKAKVMTNDFNLNKLAQLEGVGILNINELAEALKPVVLPGEEMQVHIIKEGKEYSQGVGYLDDGTMVVVDNGYDYIGRRVKTIVTSVLQTTAGRMIFTRLEGAVS
ncbi:TRAM domain-containing protein [Candidatus Desantisbacteria bacterium]|nr:TRAM domain-containing protein [Candidatus Desantisbacteria bacterium]